MPLFPPFAQPSLAFLSIEYLDRTRTNTETFHSSFEFPRSFVDGARARARLRARNVAMEGAFAERAEQGIAEGERAHALRKAFGNAVDRTVQKCDFQVRGEPTKTGAGTTWNQRDERRNGKSEEVED